MYQGKMREEVGQKCYIALHIPITYDTCTILGPEWSIPHGLVEKDKASPATQGTSGLDEHGPAHHAKGNW